MTKTKLALAAFLALLAPVAEAQQTMLQGGPWAAGRAPIYNRSGTGQPVMIDSGPAGGNTTGQGLTELNLTARGTGTAPYASQGTGQLGTIFQIQDAVSTNPTGYRALSFSANAQGGALIAYNAFGAASPLPLNFNINGTNYAFPYAIGGIVGPSTTVVDQSLCWNNTSGTLVKSCTGAAPLTIGGTNGQIQYNNAGALGGFFVGGDGTLNSSTGNLVVSKITGVSVSLGGTLTTAGAFTTSGAFPLILTSVGSTNVTLPQTGTLATLAGTEALTNKTVNGLTLTASTGTLNITNGKTLRATNTLTFSGTDSSTLNIGSGGTLGTSAFTAASAYVPSGSQITNTLSGNVSVNNTGNYFTGPTVAQGSTGTWYACGNVTVDAAASSAVVNIKLWDGTTVMASTTTTWPSAVTPAIVPISLCGVITSPAGNIRISVQNTISTAGSIMFNASGNSRDSTLTAFRVQ